jgi:hypothetical protein
MITIPKASSHKQQIKEGDHEKSYCGLDGDAISDLTPRETWGKKTGTFSAAGATGR